MSRSRFAWLKLFVRGDRPNQTRTGKARSRQRSFVPRLDALEDRCVPSVTPIDHGRLVYDSDYTDVNGVKGATWLANANLAATETFGVCGIQPSGLMTWETAMNWVAAMNRANYLGHHNWTLPLTPNKDPNGSLHDRNNDADFGFNCTADGMGHLFYDEFHGVAGQSVSDIHNASTALFHNFQPYLYWSGSLPGNDPGVNRPLPVSFQFGNGFLGTNVGADFMYAIPEFPDDPSDLPPPAPPNNIIPLHEFEPDPTLVPASDGGIIHDTRLGINWLANADLAAACTFGLPVGSNPDKSAWNINPDGSMNFATAQEWISRMNAANYLGHNNWRLPVNRDDDHAGYYHTGCELGELYYAELGGQAGSSILSTHDRAARLFHNLQPNLYWSGTTDQNPNGNGQTTFSFGSGYQGGNYDANQLYVIPVFDGNVFTVTNDHDDGPGSLRAAVAAANPGDTIEFSHDLDDATITLPSPIALDKTLYIVGLGADELTITANDSGRIFQLSRGASGTDISGLTLANGRADRGGAILDDGAALTLSDDRFTHDQAVGGPGDDAFGGAVAVLAGSTSKQTIRILRCQFDRDTAVGGAGRAGSTGDGRNGGAGEGGAVYVDAGGSAKFSVVVTDSRFSNDSAAGGDGVNAGSGGAALGGAFLYTSAAADGVTVSVVDSVFDANTAQGGRGGTGGGHGGMAAGGGLALVADSLASTTQVTVMHCAIALNTARAGDGGGGGDTGGAGGNGGRAFGGGIYLTSNGQSRADTWILKDDVVAANRAISGNGGQGGAGVGGSAEDSFGGGIYDGFRGTLDLLGVEIVANQVEGGRGGAGSARGQNSRGFGGGLAIDPGALTKADAHTRIRDNRADVGPDVFGDLDTI